MLRNKKLCVIGDPIDHSLSPVIHTAMLRKLRLTYAYGRIRVPAESTASFLAFAKAEEYGGFNATMPHKTALVSLVDELDETARLFRAVNTVVLRNGKSIGYNTDGRGFLQMLLDAGCDPAGKTVTLIGAGGAARAAALQLAVSGAERVLVCNRTLQAAQALADEFPTQISAFDLSALSDCAAASDLLVNATPLGMAGIAQQFEDLSFLDALPKGAAVCDLIYSPPETPLLTYAREKGHPSFNGLRMLIHQAIFALELFTDTKIDAQEVMNDVEDALHQAASDAPVHDTIRSKA